MSDQKAVPLHDRAERFKSDVANCDRVTVQTANSLGEWDVATYSREEVMATFYEGENVADQRPLNCRMRLRDEGKPYPKSGCQACGASVSNGLVCRYETNP